MATAKKKQTKAKKRRSVSTRKKQGHGKDYVRIALASASLVIVVVLTLSSWVTALTINDRLKKVEDKVSNTSEFVQGRVNNFADRIERERLTEQAADEISQSAEVLSERFDSINNALEVFNIGGRLDSVVGVTDDIARELERISDSNTILQEQKSQLLDRVRGVSDQVDQYETDTNNSLSGIRLFSILGAVGLTFLFVTVGISEADALNTRIQKVKKKR